MSFCATYDLDKEFRVAQRLPQVVEVGSNSGVDKTPS